MLEIRGVTRHFGGVHALSGVDLTIAGGGIVGMIGPNGAGKTTLFNCISGVLPVSGGEIHFRGERIDGMPPHLISGKGLVRTFQIARGFPRLTVLESLLLYGTDQPGEGLLQALTRSKASLRREEELLDKALKIAERLKLSHVLDNKAADLSGGQKKLLEIGRALMRDPGMLLLDEPMAGVNPSLVREIGERLITIARDGVTIILIEHQMDLISRLCDHVVVMADGRKMIEGTFEFVAGNKDVQSAYMGSRR
ncbi:ABC transporter ATP-binding protein [Neorhizobium galegae]|uniref:ABC transporter ATP-binding protein n=1 Tax=Neorhizobium galegae TaxID=399 RepID=UPI001355F479|nr:ABC transporter ATP-binding protein [Neorhizobium galegae]KAB1115065.1 ABC transporter ATP-binding protein [Neorhizobium galegae]MCQ1774384.1 ABC transporter ATP-binding protein [Neorhizobium galegae]MCQ1798958.1 ABC transporter ATP-binding protein [Neorhizobium galegae]